MTICKLVQGQLFRTRDGVTVETSFNNGKFWMSTWKSIEWFNLSTKSPIVNAPEGIYLG